LYVFEIQKSALYARHILLEGGQHRC